MNSMLRTSGIVLFAVVAALFVEDKLHRPSKDEKLGQRIEELEQAQRDMGERSRRSESEAARQRAQDASSSRVAVALKAPAHEERDNAAGSEDSTEDEPSARPKAEPARTEEEMRSA